MAKTKRGKNIENLSSRDKFFYFKGWNEGYHEASKEAIKIISKRKMKKVS